MPCAGSYCRDRALATGDFGSDPIAIIWPDAHLQHLTADHGKVTNATGLVATDDVVYFGNAVGETGGVPGLPPNDNAIDQIRILNNPKTSLDAVTATDPFERSRDGFVNGTDQTIVINNFSTFLNDLNLITAPRPDGWYRCSSGQRPIDLLPNRKISDVRSTTRRSHA